MSRERSPQQHASAIFYIHPDWRHDNPTPMIRGEATKSQIVEHSYPQESGVLNHTFQLMQSKLDNGGAISSHGKIFTPQQCGFRKDHPYNPFTITTASQLHKTYGLSIEEHDMKPNERVFVWNEQLKQFYATRHFSHEGVRPELVDDNGKHIDLSHFSEAFGEFIRRHYDMINVTPTYPVRSIARCFMIEIFGQLQAELQKQRGSQRQQPRRLHLVRH